jgi:membrane fusion protein (multidrug efflux system)
LPKQALLPNKLRKRITFMNFKYTLPACADKRKLTPYFSLILLTGTLLFSSSCKEKKNTFEQKKGNSATTVDVMIAKAENIGNQVEVNGSVVASEFAELRPEVSGLLTFLSVPEGALVQKGTVVARVNSADLEAQVSKLKVQLELAETTEKRLKQLIDINGVNQADYDIAINTVNGLKADIQYTQTLIDKTIVRAPFAGIIGLRRVSAGSYVTPSNVIATIQQLSQLRIDFTVPESYQNYVPKGSNVQVLLDQNSGTKLSARIIASEPQVNQSTRNLTVRAVLNGGTATPGSFVKVYLNEGAEKSSILVPANCIIPEAKSKKVVLVKNGKAAFVNVETGSRQEEYIEVTKGLSVGDSVVVSGVLFARQDAPVSVRSVRDVKVVTK